MKSKRMIKITNKQWKDIHKDYKGTLENGKKECYAGCIQKSGGTTLLTEGQDFVIIN
jgi:hypothetical protein